MRTIATIGTALVSGALFVALSGCERQEGPAEKAGRQLDTAIENVGKQTEKAGAEIQDAVDGDKR
jgi:hypothetical protein